MQAMLARFLLQANKDFPLDCETLDNLQNNIALANVIGNIVGDKAIIRGCELEQNGTHRKAGYVFIRTVDFPDGEIMYWHGGAVAGGMYVNKETIAVSAQGYDFPQAYVARSLMAGVGAEGFSWNDFKIVKTPSELDAQDKAQAEVISKIATPPIGIVNLWAGIVVPTGYELCEGQQFKISDYPDLYAVLGSTYNNAASYTGVKYSTSNGYFRLPDLRGRFVVGVNVNDDDYKAQGLVGGEKTHQLTVEEMPAHTHEIFLRPNGSRFTGGGRADELDSGKTNTSSTGNNAAHENRPPYYTLTYIMRVK